MSARLDSVRRLIEAYNTGKTDDVADYIHPEYLNPGTLEFTSLRGPELFALNVAWVKRTFSQDARLEEVDIEERGDWVRAKLVLYGRHVGDMVGMAPTGRLFSGEQIHLFRFVDGRIRDHRDWPDYLGTYRQLGEPWPEPGGWRP
ncbi:MULTISPECIES: ester cyclase [Streptomyces]|uniref:Ester cyclase n=3 Tax=Streptomyces TaxID=1883 RepID=A0A3Q9G378_STRLT|nr:ester cyclase [Streptomyces luteoverticillatus]AZQ74571.1 ester cyclase [Streptomyces luteoverticillatus]